jgi:hypothetical protein
MGQVVTIGLDLAKSVFQVIALGHEVKLMPAQYVKPSPARPLRASAAASRPWGTPTIWSCRGGRTSWCVR